MWRRKCGRHADWTHLCILANLNDPLGAKSGKTMPKAKLLREIFSDKKTIDNRAINLLGAQVTRSIAARIVRNRRRFPVDPELQDKREELECEGIVTWPEFLLPEDFDAVRRECLKLVETGLPSRQFGTSLVEKLSLANVGRTQLLRLLTDRRLQNLLEMSERRPLGDLLTRAQLEQITQVPANSKDQESELHSDIFFTSHKAWFYLSDVRLESGPLAFVKRSHWLTPQRLYYIYKESCTRTPDANPSRRVTPSERKKSAMRRLSYVPATLWWSQTPAGIIGVRKGRWEKSAYQFTLN